MRILLPHNNLGCLGFRIGRFYFDIYRRPCWGIFIKTPTQRMRLTSRGLKRER
jgi:hypothetical protein